MYLVRYGTCAFKMIREKLITKVQWNCRTVSCYNMLLELPATGSSTGAINWIATSSFEGPPNGDLEREPAPRLSSFLSASGLRRAIRGPAPSTR